MGNSRCSMNRLILDITYVGHFTSSFQGQIGEITMISNSYIHLPKIHILVVVVVAATQAKENISSVSVLLHHQLR